MGKASGLVVDVSGTDTPTDTEGTTAVGWPGTLDGIGFSVVVKSDVPDENGVVNSWGKDC